MPRSHSFSPASFLCSPGDPRHVGPLGWVLMSSPTLARALRPRAVKPQIGHFLPPLISKEKLNLTEAPLPFIRSQRRWITCYCDLHSKTVTFSCFSRFQVRELRREGGHCHLYELLTFLVKVFIGLEIEKGFCL